MRSPRCSLTDPSLHRLGTIPAGIKPCVSAVLGDQFCAANQPLLAPTFAAFYLAINAGASLCTGTPRGEHCS